MIKRIATIILILSFFVNSSFCFVTDYSFSSFTDKVKMMGDNVKVAANITMYATAIGGALYGIKACRKAGKAISVLIPSKCSEMVTKVPYNLVTKTPFKLIDFGRYTLISGLLFSVSLTLRSILVGQTKDKS